MIRAGGPTEGVRREGRAKTAPGSVGVLLASRRRSRGEGPLPGAAWARGQASGSAFPEQRAGEEVGWWAGGIIVLTAGWVSMKL